MTSSSKQNRQKTLNAEKQKTSFLFLTDFYKSIMNKIMTAHE